MASSSEALPQSLIDQYDTSRIISDAQLLTNGAHMQLGRLVITDTQYDALHDEMQDILAVRGESGNLNAAISSEFLRIFNDPTARLTSWERDDSARGGYSYREVDVLTETVVANLRFYGPDVPEALHGKRFYMVSDGSAIYERVMEEPISRDSLRRDEGRRISVDCKASLGINLQERASDETWQMTPVDEPTQLRLLMTLQRIAPEPGEPVTVDNYGDGHMFVTKWGGKPPSLAGTRNRHYERVLRTKKTAKSR